MRTYKIALSLLVFHAALACGEDALSTSDHDGGGTIPDAHAADDGGAGPQVFEEICDKSVMVSGVEWSYAEHFFPGRTVDDFARLTVATHMITPTFPGYEWNVFTGANVKNGAAAIGCGAKNNPTVDRVRFIMP